MTDRDGSRAPPPPPLSAFQPPVASWFSGAFAAPTDCQLAAWANIRAGRHTLVSAPTGSGKTLAAFLGAIDELCAEAARGRLPDETRVVYVSPLKALSNDIERNLEAPIAGVERALAELGAPPAGLRAQVRTGDTPSAVRRAMARTPPHILVTTPESLFILLAAESGRRMLATTRSVIVDEIHALASSKRGSHLALSLERLERLAGRPLQRIGLSATQEPIERLAAFLIGPDRGHCAIVDAGHRRERDLRLELPASPLESVMAGEVWEEIYDRIAELARARRTTLVFVNTRRLAERVARHISERLGPEAVTAHHGSLAREARLDAERRLKSGALRALVATASLELGIDIGEVDLVVQLGSTGSIATFLQRVGRSGHGMDRRPAGRLFPLSRDDLVECAALLGQVREGVLDRIAVPRSPLDVLAQHIVAAVACEEWDEGDLHGLVRGADPYRDLGRERFDAVVRMLAEGYSTRRGRRAAYLYRDAVNRRLRPRPAARLTVLTASGAIPENADYAVVLEPAGTLVGTLNEDFAIESMPGDIFQLGNSSWRILRVESGRVRVEDAHGQPPTIPFWLGEAPARSDELSRAVSALRERLDTALAAESPEETVEDRLERVRHDLDAATGIGSDAARQLVDYLYAARVALGALPTQRRPIMERFFDESGGMQLVIHSPYGGRVNRAWGLALRKRFCRRFNFELQAAATEDSIVLSLGETHSFPLEEVPRYLSAASVAEVLEQAVLDSPLFLARWRWNANVSLAVPRFSSGKKVPPPIQRMQAEDLVAAVFPDSLACAENVAGHREIPDHPLVDQTMHDALHEAMDLDGLIRLLGAIENGAVAVAARDVTEPSPLAAEILSAKPYAFLDDAPLEERRTRAVMSRRWLDPETANDIGRLDTEAIARVRAEAWPETGDPDELHDALVVAGYLTPREVAAGEVAALVGCGRATRLERAGRSLWVAAERLAELRALWPDAVADPPLAPPEGFDESVSSETALREILRARLQVLGPVSAEALGSPLGLGDAATRGALVALEDEGFVLRGRFTRQPDRSTAPSGGSVSPETEWCERRLLARIHRYTVHRLRAEIEPVSSAVFMRFLLAWHGIDPRQPREGPEGLKSVLDQLEGFEAPASAWEDDLLPARLPGYSKEWLDALCLSGRITWFRRGDPGASCAGAAAAASSITPIAIVDRATVNLWARNWSAAVAAPGAAGRAGAGQRVADVLAERGALFFQDLVDTTGLLAFQVEDALRALVHAGAVTADGFAGLRALIGRGAGRRRAVRPIVPTGRGRPRRGLAEGGRWSLVHRPDLDPSGEAGEIEAIAWVCLRRYGVLFRRLLERESRLPAWRRILEVLRRLEARGDVRGGRFVAGFSGEQFALPEAVGALRRTRRAPPGDGEVSLCAADPLNLSGILLPGPRIPSSARNRVLLRAGAPVAAEVGGAVRRLPGTSKPHPPGVAPALRRRAAARR